ncbi:MAG: hypothetical protein GY847_22815, partial [Proteobacteria bacterium]|nr:hypothetical protein [Pseudomonadota bacterium]
DGRQDGAFVWSARGKDLHGAAVGELEISPASALLIQRYVDGRFWGDEQVTLNFVEKASVEIASHSDLPHMVFDVVDSSDIAEFEPLLLERDREDIVDGQPQADSPATFWWRVAAYDDRDRRIGGLAELISVSNHSSVACSLDTVGDEFALWRAQPGDCEVVITAEEIKQVFTITFV